MKSFTIYFWTLCASEQQPVEDCSYGVSSRVMELIWNGTKPQRKLWNHSVHVAPYKKTFITPMKSVVNGHDACSRSRSNSRIEDPRMWFVDLDDR